MKNKYLWVTSILVSLFLFSGVALAQNENRLDYKESLILDSDLDGLTDLGEKEIYKTEVMNPDSDGDGFLDGVEVIKNTNPLNNASPIATKIISTQETVVEKEVPLGWYISRTSGLVAYFLLWWVMFFGLAIRTPLLKNVLAPIFSLETHAWLSVQALFFAFFHMGALLWDKFLQFQILDLIMPFHSSTYTSEVTLGILGLYLMILLILSSYFRKFYSHRIWRLVHVMNIVLFLVVTIHALLIGTDLKSGLLLRDFFIGMNGLLVLVMVVNLGGRLKNAIFAKKVL
jgi:methionine sulfoxide reductase heme-binding subunit